MLVIVYNQKICKEIILPKIFNADYNVTLGDQEYALRQKLVLRFENTPAGWLIHASSNYGMVYKRESISKRLLQDEDILTLNTTSGDKLFLIAVNQNTTFKVMEKYDLNACSSISIGKNLDHAISFDFMGLISSNHGTLKNAHGKWYIVDSSSNGIFVNHVRVNRSRVLSYGDDIQVFGLHMVFLDSVLLISANCGTLHVKESLPLLRIAPVQESNFSHQVKEEQFFNRSPRNFPVLYNEEIQIEDPPQPKTQKQKPAYMIIGPAFTMAIPMTLGFVLAAVASQMSGTSANTFMYTGLITAVGSAVIGGIWAILNLNYSKKESVEEETQRFNAYSNYLISITNTIRAQFHHNTVALNQIDPPARTVLKYGFTSRELWNRNFTHDDFLHIRIGTSDRPFQVKITVPKEKFSLINDTLASKPSAIQKEFSVLHNVPICIDLKGHQLIGLIGGRNKIGALALMHVIVAETAASHCYTDVKFVFLFDENDSDTRNAWECMRWFPHVWSEDKSTRYMAGTPMEKRDVLFELSNIIRTRIEQNEGYSRGNRVEKPHYIIFVSDPSLLSEETIARYIYDPHPEYGITTILLAETAADLPNECTYIVHNTNRDASVYTTTLQNTDRQIFVPDTISEKDLEAFGKKLANIKVREIETNTEIPNSLTFLEMYGVRTVQELNVLEKWRKNRTYQSMKALIGEKAGGADCYLDVHEKFHGPHGLVAGTTGSGKSETLQTYILSLAVNFSPEDVSFFIIDFKGGGMANLFEKLPHLAGHISNLSGNQIQRAMISIKSENMRRQRLFARFGVNNINLYTQLYKNHETDIAIPHLFIIIDEFAELKREEPEFMAELISVAQVGRSLGVHLILSTQKPSGTVDDNIWSNSRFRLCLRVQDRQDSMDMLHRPDAAFLTQAGRCYLQVGNDEIFELFQSGYSGAIYNTDAETISSTALIGRTGKAALFYPRQIANEHGNIRQITQLDAVIEHLRNICKANGYANSSQLWLPPLPAKIILSSLQSKEEPMFRHHTWPNRNHDDISTVIGLYDDPANQKQAPLELNFTEGGHLAVLGTAVSGKSTFLQTLVYALLMGYSPDVINFYLIDYSGRRLTPFKDAPHVGGVVTEDDNDRVDKFFHMLSVMLEERKTLLKGGNFHQFVQINGYSLPAIFVVLDNYESFREKTEDRYADEILQLTREGISRGIYFVVSAQGFGLNAIPNRVGDNIRTIVSLEQQDKFKYMDALRITHLDMIPETNVRGRGLAVLDDKVLEFQTALAIEAEDDFTRSEELEQVSHFMCECWTGKTARRIPEIPVDPKSEDLIAHDSFQAELAKQRVPFAWRQNDASLYSFDPSYNFCFSILGKARSGKTNVMKMMLMSASSLDADRVVIEKNSGFIELKKLAEESNATYITDVNELYDFFARLTPEFKRRNQKKRQRIAEGVDENTLRKEMAEEKPILIFIANIKDFLEMIYSEEGKEKNMPGFIENILDRGSLHHISLIACVSQEDANTLSMYRAYNYFIRYAKGIVIAGSVSSQRILNFRGLSYNEQNRNLKKGYGYVTDDQEEGNGIVVALPLVKGQI